MSWTYIPELDEYDKEVTKDSSSNRYTFRRYMYFKPNTYDAWATRQAYSNPPFTAELVGNANIPTPGTYLTGSLSAFYVNEVISIRNLSEEEHGDHCSYAVVTIEYENEPSNESSSGSGSSAQPERGLKPWQQKVDDFTITNQEISIPLTEAYEETSLDEFTPYKETIATTAGQVLYGFTGSRWISRLTWTFNDTDNGPNYSITEPIINNANVTIFDKITIPKGEGLLLPPGYRKMYYYKNGNDRNPTAYNQWTFEIIVDSEQFFLEVLNAGTQAYFGSGQNKKRSDICTWYVYDPDDADNPPTKEFGTFSEMMEAKLDVDEVNKSIEDENLKLVFNGDFVQNPVPLTENGEVDEQNLENPTNIYRRWYIPYERGTWSLGIR